MSKKALSALTLGLVLSFAVHAAKGETTKPPVLDLQEQIDRMYTDGCYQSNCGSVPAHETAQARVEERRAVNGSPFNFLTFTPTYVPPASCTSLLGQADNAWLQVLDTGVRTPNGRNLDLTFNAEGRVQRANGSNLTGIGAVATQVFIDEINPGINGGNPVTTLLFSRWVIHSGVDSSLIEDVANPSAINQPVINSTSVRRFVSLAAGSTYRIRVEAKWSDVFTGLSFEPSTAPFVASGAARGALICVPVLSVLENAL